MCCMWLAGNTGCKNDAKNRHLGTIAQLCRAITLQLMHVSTIGKTCKQQYLLQLHISSQHGELWATNDWDRLGSLGHPRKFQRFRVLASSLKQRHSTEVNQTLRCLAVSWAGTLYIHFRGSCPLMEFCQVQNSLCVQVLHSSILAALLHGTPAADVSQTSRRGTRNGITELLQTAPPIFGWAAIMFLASAHILVLSSFFLTNSQWSEIGCLPCFHTWYSLSANLECRSETCCTLLADNTGRKKSPKIRHRRTITHIVGLYLRT